MLLIQYWTDLCPNEKFNGVNSSLVQMGETLLNQEPNESFLWVNHGSQARTNDIVNLKSLPDSFLNTIIICNQLFVK